MQIIYKQTCFLQYYLRIQTIKKIQTIFTRIFKINLVQLTAPLTKFNVNDIFKFFLGKKISFIFAFNLFFHLFLTKNYFKFQTSNLAEVKETMAYIKQVSEFKNESNQDYYIIATEQKDDVKILVEILESQYNLQPTTNELSQPKFTFIIRNEIGKITKKYYDTQTLLLNILSGNQDCICNKYNLYKFVEKHYPDELKTFMMPTYQIREFDSQKHLNFPYMIKPVGINCFRGQGIVIAKNKLQVEQFILSKKDFSFYIFTEYIRRPLLFEGRKFHLRVCFMVALIGDYFFTSVLNFFRLVIAPKIFENSNYQDFSIHDTHLKNSYKTEFLQTSQEFNSDKITLIQQQISKILSLISSKIYNEFKTYDNSTNGFQVLGVDFMIQDDYQVKLIEINEKAAFSRFQDQEDHNKFYSQYYPWIQKAVLDNLFNNCSNINENKIILYTHKFQQNKSIPPELNSLLEEKVQKQLCQEQNLYLKWIHQLNYLETQEFTKLTSQKETMQFIGQGNIWDIQYIQELQHFSSQDFKKDNPQYLHWIIFDSSCAIGYIGIHPFNENQNYQLRIFIGKKYQQMGYSVLAIKLLYEQLESIGIKKLWSLCRIDNQASINMTKKAGFVKDKSLKNYGRYQFFVFYNDNFIHYYNQQNILDLSLYIQQNILEIIDFTTISKDQYVIIDSIFKQIKQDNILFPYQKFLFKLNPIAIFQKLKNYQPKINNFPQPFFNKSNFSNQFLDSYLSFESNPLDYENIDIITDYFNEQQRIKGKLNFQSFSLFEGWKNYDYIKQIILQNFKDNPSKQSISSQDIRELFWKSGIQCNFFKTTLAFSVYKHFNSKTILDISAGWGDRLIGAIAANCDRYLSYDPNIFLQKGHNQIIECYVPLQARNQFEVRYEPFENGDLGNQKFDLVFSSPPYFDLQIYTNSQGQSIISYPNFDDWLVKFLFKCIYKSWESLCEKGNMVMHINDFWDQQFIDMMIQFVKGWCKNSTFQGVIFSIGDSQKPRPLWVFHQGNINFEEQSKHAQENLLYDNKKIYQLVCSLFK